jgi:HPt (histidine-containing phosphotransfer) domain-containing protein
MTMRPTGPESVFSSCNAGLAETTSHAGQETEAAGVFDQIAALMRVEGDIELLLEIVEIFLEDSPRLMTRIRTALERQELKSLEQVAHTLKGSVGNFFAPAVYAAAAKLETLGREGNVTGAQKAWSELQETMEQLRLALMSLRDGMIA